MCLYQNECNYIKMHTNGTTRDQKFHPVEGQHLSQLFKSVESHKITYQNARAYIKMNEMCAWDGQKCTKNFFSEKKA